MLCTDSRYEGTAERECPDVELLIERSVEEALIGRALAGGMRAIGFEDREMTVLRHRALAEAGAREETAGRSLVLTGVGGLFDELPGDQGRRRA